MPEMVGDDWRGWLVALDEQICDDEGYEKKRLSEREWATLKDILTAHRDDLICEIHNACMGFGCGLTIYEVPPRVYPGADTPPDSLVEVTKNHLPLSVCDLRTPEESQLRDRTFFMDGWRAFSPFSHHPDNVARLVAHGFEPPKDMSHYDY